MPTLWKKTETLKLEIHNKPDTELLLFCIRPQIDDLAANRIKTLVRENINWENLLQTAYTHGLIPLVYTRLNTICPKEISESTFNKFRSLFQAIATRNLFLTGELVKLLELLKEQGVTAVPYKGPVLASVIYGNVALRHFVDLDILVQPQDIFTVKKLLLAQGYKPKLEMTYAEEMTYLQSKNEHTYDFVHQNKGILIEVHWRIAPKYLSIIEPKDLWQDIEPLSLASQTIDYLPLEDWLPILCVHGSRHMWERLAWLCDIAALIQNHPNLNWQKIVKQANTFGCRRILFLGLVLAHEIFGVVLPIEIWHLVRRDATVFAIVPQVYKQIFAQVRTSDKFLGRTLYQIQVRERWQDKILYIQTFLDWLIIRRQ
jgi:hypothetical protein